MNKLKLNPRCQLFLNWCSSLAAAVIASISTMPATASAQLIRSELSAYGTTPGTSVQSVALNGAYLAVGNPTDDSNRGAVIIFDAVSGKRLKIFQGTAAGDKFGHAVALRGNELIVGAPGFNGNMGVVRIYDIVTSRQLFFYDAGSAAGQLGFSVAADGEFIVAGAPMGTNGVLGGFDRGYAVVFKSAPGGWSSSSTNTIWPNDPENDAFFGYSVAVYGSTVAVGAPFHNATALNNSGKVYLFDGNALSATPNSVLDSTPTVNNNFGWAVALTPSHLVASAPFADGNKGRVDYYNLQTYTSISSLGIPGALHGSSLAASETHVVVGSPGWTSPGYTAHGMVEVYLEPTETASWTTLSAYLRPLQLYNNGKHGFCVALHGASLAAGAKDQGTVVLGTNLTATEESFSTDLLRDQFRKGEMVTNTSTIGTRTMASFTQAASSGISPATSRVTSIAIGKDRNFGSSAADGLFAAGPAGLNTMSLRSKVSPATIGGFPSIRSISAINDFIGNSPEFYAGHVTASRTGRPVSRDLWIFNPTSSNFAQIIPGNDLTNYVLASFTNARHGVYGVANTDLFVLPSRLRTKTGSAPVTPANDSALLFFTPSAAEVGGLREGASLSPYGAAFGQFTGRCGFEKNNLAFSSALQGATPLLDSCLVNFNISSLALTGIAREDDVALGTGGAKFSAFLGETTNGFSVSGEILFRATIRGGSPAVTAANNEGLWSNRFGASPPALVFRKGQNPDGIFPSGVRISRFLKYWINANGVVYSLVGLTGQGVTSANDVALISSSSSGFIGLLLYEGSAAPGLRGGTIGTISQVDGRESGNWVALCTVAQKTGLANATNDQVLYRYNDIGGIYPQPVVALRKGTRINRAGNEVIKSINLANKIDDGASGALATGMGHVLAPGRQITAILTYNDGYQTVTEVQP